MHMISFNRSFNSLLSVASWKIVFKRLSKSVKLKLHVVQLLAIYGEVYPRSQFLFCFVGNLSLFSVNIASIHVFFLGNYGQPAPDEILENIYPAINDKTDKSRLEIISETLFSCSVLIKWRILEEKNTKFNLNFSSLKTLRYLSKEIQDLKL